MQAWRWGHGLHHGVPRGGRGRQGWRRCSDVVEEEEGTGVAGMALGVEEEDGVTAIDDSAGGGAALVFGLKK